MFSGLQIHLTDPICKCDEQDISWSITWNLKEGSDRYQAGLRLTCQSCGISLNIPPDEFKASIHFAKPYPGKKVPAPSKDKVVHLALVEKKKDV
jgi:hypothetical protein